MKLYTQRLYLRHFTLDDAPALYELAKEKDIGHWCGFSSHQSIADSQRIIEQHLQNAYAVFSLKENGLVGSVELRKGGELGYWIGKPYWRQGYAKEAIRLLLDRSPYERVSAYVHENNQASQALLTSLGFDSSRRPFVRYLPAIHDKRLAYEYVLKQPALRQAKMGDEKALASLYAKARAFMIKSGNLNQWKNNWPPEQVTLDDIYKRQLYVYEYNGLIVGAFVLLYGAHCDPCYNKMVSGQWLSGNHAPYAVIHRIASLQPGLGKRSLRVAESLGHVRIDTHPDNVIMQNLLTSSGYTLCGSIHVAQDDTPRLAYEKIQSQIK